MERAAKQVAFRLSNRSSHLRQVSNNSGEVHFVFPGVIRIQRLLGWNEDEIFCFLPAETHLNQFREQSLSKTTKLQQGDVIFAEADHLRPR
jgi:hypothetical protein